MIASTKSKIAFLVILILLTVTFYLLKSSSSSRIAKRHTVVCGRITGSEAGISLGITYTFEYKGESFVYNHSSTKKVFMDFKNGKTNILIAVENDNPKNHEILFTSEDFARLTISSNDTSYVKCN